jgi:hypothetical protein
LSREAISSVLSKYLPSTTVDECTSWVILKNIHLKITKGRSSKFGDYLPLGPGKGHRITINHDLNKYAFLITFVHEVAHLHCFEKFNRKHEPHGKEWKSEFRVLLSQFVSKGIFPEDIQQAVSRYLHNPAASSCSDQDLFRALKKYDAPQAQPVVHLEDLPEKSIFRIHQNRSDFTFIKGHRRRTRFQCLELRSKRIYFVNALTEVIVVSEEIR